MIFGQPSLWGTFKSAIVVGTLLDKMCFTARFNESFFTFKETLISSKTKFEDQMKKK